MATLILSTKISIPPLREDCALRPRLLERCATGLARKLLLVSAPAGFGKTTLLTAWIHHEQQHGQARFGWLSLDHEDSTLARFWTYFIRALQVVIPELGEPALGMLEASEQPPLENVLTVLLNAIATYDQPLVLVLDDYHLLEAPAIHESLLFFLEHQPPHFHLVLATRIDPPCPWRGCAPGNRSRNCARATCASPMKKPPNSFTGRCGCTCRRRMSPRWVHAPRAEYVKKIEWRTSIRWPIFGPYVFMYLATVMFYWFPLALVYKPLWYVYAALFVVSTFLNVTSHSRTD